MHPQRETRPDPAPVDVGFVVDSDAVGGAEAYVRHLLRRLPDRFRRRLVVTEPVADAFADVVDRCVDVAVIPLVRGTDGSPALERALDARPVDVWHVNLVDVDSNRAALAAASGRGPTAATLHMPGRSGAAEVGPVYGRLASAIAVSAEVERVLTDELGVRRVDRIRNGVEIPQTVTSRAGYPTRIGGVGRLTAQKGFDVLVAAIAELRRRGFPCEVVVAGEGRDRATLERTAARLPVTFPGHTSDVPGFLRGLDVFCLPSRREGLPLALLEAMAHGLPCVATDVGDVAEAAGDAVWLVPPDDTRALAAALAALLDDAELRRDLGRRARDRAARHLDVTDMVAATADVLAAAARSQASSASAWASTASAGSR